MTPLEQQPGIGVEVNEEQEWRDSNQDEYVQRIAASRSNQG
jgi:hypothetical protein